jgi:nucleotide-binding universal stress UspA family protein
MPPMLRWMFARVPQRDDEQRRLDKEEAEEKQALPKMERALVFVDDSANGAMATNLAGAFASSRQVMTTVMHVTPDADRSTDQRGVAHAKALEVADAALARVSAEEPEAETAATSKRPKSSELIHSKSNEGDDAIEKEVGKGYGIVFAGLDEPFPQTLRGFAASLQTVVDAFEGPMAITMNGDRFPSSPHAPLNILVPTAGAPHARLATEIALALAKATGGKVTVFHVFDPMEDTNILRGRARRFGMSILVDARALGKQSGVRVEALTAMESRPEIAIRRAIAQGGFDLVVAGAVFRVGEKKFMGPRSTALVRSINAPLLLIAQ